MQNPSLAIDTLLRDNHGNRTKPNGEPNAQATQIVQEAICRAYPIPSGLSKLRKSLFWTHPASVQAQKIFMCAESGCERTMKRSGNTDHGCGAAGVDVASRGDASGSSEDDAGNN